MSDIFDFDLKEADHILITVNIICGCFFLASLGAAIYLLFTRDIKDRFISLSLYGLCGALLSRVIMCTICAAEDDSTFEETQNVPLQQVYFEVPYYCFVVVTMATIFGWYQLFVQVNNFVEGIDL